MKKYSPMFHGSLREINVVEHRLQLAPCAKPSISHPYRERPEPWLIIRGEVQKNLRAGVLEQFKFAWASPVVLVSKPYDFIRSCVDYRKCNSVTVRDSYPLSRIDDCIDSLREATVFPALDSNSELWQVVVPEEDKNETDTVSHARNYRYKRRPFGLHNATATFQGALDILLSY